MEHLVREINNVDFEITFACNLRCLHCYNEGHKVRDELSVQQIFEGIDQIRELGFQEIHINGGEPLVHKQALDIISYCDDHELDTILETNGTLLTANILERLAEMKHLKIRASIDGSEDTHNSIRRTTTIINPYSLTLTNLSYAKNMGIPVQITTSVNNINYMSIYDMVTDLNCRGISDIRLRLSMPSKSGYDHWQILRLNSQKMNFLREQAGLLKEKYGASFNSESLFRNIPGSYRKCFITPHGNVKPYPFIDAYAGNIRESKLKDILQNYGSVSFPHKIERMMVNYLTELGMVD